MFLDTTGENETQRVSVICYRMCDDLDEVCNHAFIITLVESIYDKDHRGSRHACRPNWINDQFLELVFERPMKDMMIPLQGAFDI
jgi:hypothetical protein